MNSKIFKFLELKIINLNNKIKIMDLGNGFFLGKDNSGFIVWNDKELKVLQSKDFKEAVVEVKLITKNKIQNVK